MIRRCGLHSISTRTFWRVPRSSPRGGVPLRAASFLSWRAVPWRLPADPRGSEMACRFCPGSEECDSSRPRLSTGSATNPSAWPSYLTRTCWLRFSIPRSLHHEAAHAWFGRNRRAQWATCPVTENALVRILSNTSYPGGRTTIEDALARLREFCSDRLHVFWPDSVSLRNPGSFRWNHVQGHRQLTDIYLLALSVSNEGRLATFDATISPKAVQGASARNLELLAT